MIGAPRGRTIAAREPSPLSPVLPTAVKPHPTPLPPIVGISSMATRPVLAEQVGIEPNALREAFDDGVVTKQVIADEEEFKANGFQGVPAMLIGEKNFSPKSFMPVTGYTNIDELEKLIPIKSLLGNN